ncbi:cyclase family protein [Thalassotalea euphylliae]|uniref:cyclase family protein n=1 Tax=Thalassotalea euphylliae TaxID=1655234 RepID=UPI003637508A
MEVHIQLGTMRFSVNTEFGHNCAISQNFNENQPNHFGAQHALKESMVAGSFIGDTEKGGSCNVSTITLNPHCNGTHTESIRHICDASAPLSVAIGDIALPPMLPCVLISVAPESARDCGDDYTPAFDEGDSVITRQTLEQALSQYNNDQLTAVAIRTLPNNAEKQNAVYDEENQPTFFTRDAILYLNERGTEHLIVDIPSIDRLHDDGLLTCHHLFWQVFENTHHPAQHSLVNKTITEMAYFDNMLVDGFYMLSLQFPAFDLDAAPSKPVLFPTNRID